MKHTKKALLTLLAVVTLVITGNAQKVLDGAWVKENTLTRKPIIYTDVREADVMWHRRIWREIDLREKINHPFYYPITPISNRKSLFDVIKDGVTEGTLTAYSDVDDEFTVVLTKSEVKAKMGDTVVVFLEDEYGDPTIEKKTYQEVQSQDVVKYWIKEDWFFDRERSIMDVRIIGICPIKNKLNDDGSVRGIQQLFWIYFPEARYVFANYDVFNRGNDAERRTFDDMFWKRMFNSYILKRSNVYERFTSDYKTGTDLLVEADDLKNDMFNFEHDLWEF